jgi:hypothetical protein
VEARKTRLFSERRIIQDFFKARVTPLSVRTIDVASLHPRGSSNIRAAEITPIRGTSSMPVEAIAGGK